MFGLERQRKPIDDAVRAEVVITRTYTHSQRNESLFVSALKVVDKKASLLRVLQFMFLIKLSHECF